MAYSTAFTGFVRDPNGTDSYEPVCFVGVGGYWSGRREARFCRFVTVPEWQGAGISMRFLEWLCERELRGEGFIGRPTTSLIHSAHPALAVSLRRNPKWRQISQALHGVKKKPVGPGGHLRAMMGFRYYGQAGIDAWKARPTA